MTAPDISIILPTHNRAHLVGPAINSLLDLRSFGITPEVIVVNDGSTDSTAQALQQFAKDIVIVTTTHGERSKARNAGTARASAPIVGFLDDDDLCLAGGWKQLFAGLEAAPEASFVFGRAEFVGQDGAPLPYCSEPELLDTGGLLFSLLSRGCHICMGTILVRREALQAVGAFNEELSSWEDWDLWLRMAEEHRGEFVDAVCAKITNPAWDAPNAHNWPTKLLVRSLHSLNELSFSKLKQNTNIEALAAFYEQLACDCYTYRLYSLSKQAFKRWRSLSSARWTDKRFLQYSVANIRSNLQPASLESVSDGVKNNPSSSIGNEKVAVVIPTYNRAALVKRAIESVLAQTVPPDEIIVVSDGSTDATAEVVSSYPNVRLITKENGGLSSARNAGIEATNAEWVAFLDDDDWYGPEMLARQRELLYNDLSVDLIYTATNRVDGNEKIIGRSHGGHRRPQDPLRALAMENFILCSAVRVRRNLLTSAGMFDTSLRLCEDQDMWIRVAALTSNFGYLEQPLAYITRSPGSMSDSNERMAQATIEVLKRRSSFLDRLKSASGPEWWLANAHCRLGRVYWEREDWLSAEREFALAIQVDSSNRQARLYCWSSKHPGARRAFRAVRGVKRAVMSVLQRFRLAEARWGR